MTGGDENETRFFGAGNDLDFDTGFATDARDEFGAVLGLAHRAGSNRTHPVDATKFDELLEVAQGADGEVHRFLAEASGFESAPAEADGFLDPADGGNAAVP